MAQFLKTKELQSFYKHEVQRQINEAQEAVTITPETIVGFLSREKLLGVPTYLKPLVVLFETTYSQLTESIEYKNKQQKEPV